MKFYYQFYVLQIEATEARTVSNKVKQQNKVVSAELLHLGT